MRTLITIGVIVIMLLISGSMDNRKVAPDFSFKNFNGKTEKLSDYQDRVIVLNYWAKWCPYCVQELSEIDAVYKENKNVWFISIVVDDEGNPKEYIKQKKYEWIFGLDIDGQKKYGISSIPVTLFIDQDGYIVSKKVGKLTKKDLEKELK
jgi:thiol-disulfide isomerase/thioredoxin